MATIRPPNAEHSVETPQTAPAVRYLDDLSARQLGVWLAGEVKRIAGWTSASTPTSTGLPDLDTQRAGLLGRLVYDACLAFNREGRFPVDVAMYGLDQHKQQAGIVNQHGETVESTGP